MLPSLSRGTPRPGRSQGGGPARRLSHQEQRRLEALARGALGRRVEAGRVGEGTHDHHAVARGDLGRRHRREVVDLRRVGLRRRHRRGRGRVRRRVVRLVDRLGRVRRLGRRHLEDQRHRVVVAVDGDLHERRGRLGERLVGVLGEGRGDLLHGMLRGRGGDGRSGDGGDGEHRGEEPESLRHGILPACGPITSAR